MIYTITFNPSLDYFVYLDQELTEGSIIKTRNTAIRAGGKGVNISIVLSHMGIQSKAILFLGGGIGELIDREISEKQGIEVIPIKITEENRINVKIKNQTETAINALGPRVSAEQQEALLAALNGLTKEDYVLISGSFCQGVNAELVERIAERVHRAEERLITDIPNLTLAHYQKIKPYLIKPNLEELAMIFSEKIDEVNYPRYAQALIEAGVENVLVSLGREGAYFASQCKRYQLSGPDVEVINTVGCGDSMLACMVASLASRHSLTEALKYGEAAGRAKAAARGLPTCEDVESLVEKVTVVEVQRKEERERLNE